MMDGKQAGQAVTTMAGIDANRRVAWALYYGTKEDLERTLKTNKALLRRLALLVVVVSECEGIAPESEAARVALGILGSLQRTSRGARALAAVQEERQKKTT